MIQIDFNTIPLYFSTLDPLRILLEKRNFYHTNLDGVSVNYSLSNAFNERLVDGEKIRVLRNEYFTQTLIKMALAPLLYPFIYSFF